MGKLGLLLAAGVLLYGCAAQMTARTGDLSVPRDAYGQPVLAGAAR